MNNKIIISTITLFVFVGIWYYFAGNKEGGEYNEEIRDTTTSLRIGANAIYVSDQKPGDITIDFTDISNGGYVIIHETVVNIESDVVTPADIIGNSLFLQPGESQNIPITLSRESKDGEKLIAMLHTDDGDTVYNPLYDSPLQDSNGSIIYMIFNISEESEVPGEFSL